MADLRFHEILDLRDARRVLTFGDTHGCLELLAATLKANGYDPEAGDVAVGMGDWMDRGPAGLPEMNAFLDAHPRIKWVRGNHDEMLRSACYPDGRIDQDTSCYNLVRNGGGWAVDYSDDNTGLPDATLTRLADRLNDAPIAYTVLTPGGRRVGLVHAGVPAETWDEMVAALEGPDPAREAMAWDCQWMRKAAEYAIAEAARGMRCDDWIVPGIDRVVYGHTIVPAPINHGNQWWIDTGAFRTGTLTMLDLDAL